jgi:uncharacterized LabA/DUF88 family protein
MKPNYAFIDSQNLNLGVRSLGWRIDYKKFRLYLRNKYNIDHAFVFIGMVENNQTLYTELQKAGFILIFKPTIQYLKDGKEVVKGNVDAELVLHASAIEYNNYDKAIIITGDGDFACLIDFLIQRDKLLHVFTPSAKYSQLLKPFASYIVPVSRLRKSIALKNDQHRRSVKTLGLSDHGNNQNIPTITSNVNQQSPPHGNY